MFYSSFPTCSKLLPNIVFFIEANRGHVVWLHDLIIAQSTLDYTPGQTCIWWPPMEETSWLVPPGRSLYWPLLISASRFNSPVRLALDIEYINLSSATLFHQLIMINTYFNSLKTLLVAKISHFMIRIYTYCEKSFFYKFGLPLCPPTSLWNKWSSCSIDYVSCLYE